MSKLAPPKADWRDARRQSAREAIVDTAWSLVHEEGLAALSLRDLAKRAGITTPTVYAYFDSKNSIYDAMFGRAATAFDRRMDEPYTAGEPEAVLLEGAHRFAQFCVTDIPRYQLLFQRTIPGFAPSPESFAPAIRALNSTRQRLAAAGVGSSRHVDLWTALLTGVVDQQISNDPGGERWIALIDEATAMFLAHCRVKRLAAKRPTRKPTIKGVPS